MDFLKKQIDQTLNSEEFIKLYRQIREKYEPIKPFNTPNEVIEFLHDFKQKHYQANNSILGALIKEYQQSSQNPLIYNYLFKIFTPGLNVLFRRFRERIEENTSVDSIDLWSQIRLLLLDILSAYDVEASPEKIAPIIIGRIKSRLDFWHYKLKRERYGIAAYKNEFIREKSTVIPEPDPVDSLEFIKGKLGELVAQGIIKEKDLLIVLATRVYGKSLEELAKERGVSYASLKMRRRRVEKKIKKFLLP